AWRNVSRNKVYATINILGLSLGICACIVIFLITQFELSFDQFELDNNRIYRIAGEFQDKSGQKFFVNNVFADIAGIQHQITGFETTGAFHSYGGSITIPDGSNQPKKIENRIESSYGPTAIFTWPSYFNIFQHEWILGNPQSLDQPFKVVLTEGRARKYFGNISMDQMIGKTVIYDDSLQVSVSGIVKDWTKNSDFNFTDFISVSSATHSFLKSNIPTEDWSSLRPHNGSAFVKLNKNVTPEQINKKLSQFIKTHVKDNAGTLTLFLQPLSSIHFTDEYRRGDDGDDFRKPHMPTLYVLMGIAIFVLIIAAVNFVNLSTALSIQRVKEIGVRKVMGGSKRNITIQFLVETFILAFFAVLLSVMLVDPMLGLFKDFIPPGLVFHPLTLPTLTFLAFITVITTLLAGFYPARVLSSFLPALSLKGNAFQKGVDKINIRKALIVFQFTMSLIFIIAVIAMSKQMNYMTKGEKGFNADAVITINKWNDNGRLRLLAESIKHIPGVSNTLLQATAPMG
ncbi:MAG TPA: ABC transporter permease, partial [Puia sp.]|nr:ABC transporter permease [Puia sp.]